MSRRLLAGSHRGAPRFRAALVGLSLAAAVAVTGIALGGPPAQAADGSGAPRMAQAAPTGTTATTVTTGDRTLTVAASPDTGLAPSGAKITVAGKGFDPSHDLWVAVCQDDGQAPAALTNCVGGAIPEDNNTTGWGIVTDAKQSPYPGPVVTTWGPGGTFEMTLQLPSAISESADCVSAPCAVYTRSSVDTGSEDVGVRIAFASPPGGSSQQGSSTAGDTTAASSSAPASSAEPTTQTFGEVPTTVTPNSMLQTTVVAGGPQTVVFAGFRPGEKVDVTLFSDPVTLPAVTADPSGNVRVSFTVPKDLPAGEHILQAIGTQSRRVGIARFTVTAASTSASASASATASSSAAVSSTAPATSSAVMTVASSTSVPSTSSPASTVTAVTSSSAAAAAGGGNRLLWLWIVLAVLVIVGGAAAIVAMVRNRRDGEEDAPLARATTVAPTPGWSGGPGGAPGTGSPGEATGVNPGGGFGLLSGRDHPDGPGLLAGGGWPDQPTEWIAGPGGGGDVGPAEDTAEDPAGGPATAQWRPDFVQGQDAPGTEGQQPGAHHRYPGPAGEQPPDDGDQPPTGRHRTE